MGTGTAKYRVQNNKEGENAKKKEPDTISKHYRSTTTMPNFHIQMILNCIDHRLKIRIQIRSAEGKETYPALHSGTWRNLNYIWWINTNV